MYMCTPIYIYIYIGVYRYRYRQIAIYNVEGDRERYARGIHRTARRTTIDASICTYVYIYM